MNMVARTYVQDVAPEGFVAVMEHNGFKASLMKTCKLEDCGYAHGLPPGERVPVFPISRLPGCPDEWVREAGTYVCPVDTDWGLWFDWTSNDTYNTAVVPSVKGMNPITGRKMEGPHMESYVEKCPIHDIPFSHGLLCEECGFRWPAQNYVTRESTLWLDGFRQPDGKVRQFFFSDEEKRDIASLVIGKKSTVPAFGFIFYEPKDRREAPIVPFYPGSAGYVGGNLVDHSFLWTNTSGDHHYTYKGPFFTSGDHTGPTGPTGPSGSGGISGHVGTTTGDATCYHVNSSDLDGISLTSGFSKPFGAKAASGTCSASSLSSGSGSSQRTSRKNLVSKSKGSRKKSLSKRSASKSVSVGAGAEIRQAIKRDELGIDGWKDEPSSVIRLYFCFEEQFTDIVNRGGVKEVQTNADGFLAGLPMGD